MTTYLYGYQTPFQRLTLAELETRATWYNLDSEFRRRLIAMFDHGQATGHDVGIGGGWRSSAQQEALFRSRYHVVVCPGQITWDGKCWVKNAGVAPSAPPGRSYHEDTTPDGAIAADLIGDIAWADDVADQFGLRSLGALVAPNNELWHQQPLEVATARRNFAGGELERFDLPGQPPPPPDEEDEMPILRRVQGSTATLVIDGAIATWVKRGDAIDPAIADGLIRDGRDHDIPVIALGVLTLHGTVGQHSVEPGRTIEITAGHFAGQIV